MFSKVPSWLWSTKIKCGEHAHFQDHVDPSADGGCMLLGAVLLFVFCLFACFSVASSIRKFGSQGSNLHHSNNNTRSLNCRVTRELQSCSFLNFFYITQWIYYIYSCAWSPQPNFIAFPSHNPSASPHPPNLSPLETLSSSKSVSQYLFCKEVHSVLFLDSIYKW